jgi:sec-independent protein translocase protein TatB
VFDSIGWGEVLVLALAALFIFGPERLPNLAKDAAGALKRMRATIAEVRGHVDETIGDDLADLRDLDLRRYHPRTFIRDQLFGDDVTDGDPPVPPVRRASGNGSAGLVDGSGATASRVWPGDAVRPRDTATPPPFDADAT